jgi:hypothetical protein
METSRTATNHLTRSTASEFTGHQTVSNNRCDDPSSAGVYVAGSGAIVHDVTNTWNNGYPWPIVPWGGSFGVTLANGATHDLVDGVSLVGLSTFGQQVVAQQGTTDSATVVTNNPGASYVVPGPGFGVPNPQGRLTLQSQTPVMTSNVTVVTPTIIYYDCYTGPNVPYFNGGSDSLDSVGSCELSLPLVASGTGEELSGDVFDVWWWHNGGSPVLCVATNGSGNGWMGDGGSTHGRGSTYTKLDSTTRGYITNKKSFVAGSSYCYNGSRDYVSAALGGVIPANNLTYLGSFYTTANGQTKFIPQPTAASGGGTAIIAIWNAYNRVPVAPFEQDTASAYGTSGSGWEKADAANPLGSTNQIEVIDGNQQTAFDLLLTQVLNNNSSGNPELSINLGNICTSPTPQTFATQLSTSQITVAYNFSNAAQLGFQCAQAMEKGVHTSGNLFNASSALTMRLNWQY